jgi:non-heme chloroperoxidase
MKTRIIISLGILTFLASLNIMSRSSETSERREIKAQKILLPNGIQMEYAEYGKKNGTPIIFLHGYTDSWHSFEDVLSRFSSEYHAIALSQRGHGDSDRPASYEFKDFAADVAQFIRKKDLGRCIIVGHSLGGLIAQQVALDYPELTKGIVIVSSAPSFADNAGVPEFIEEVMKLSDPIERRFAEDFQKSTLAHSISPDFLNLYIDETAKVPARVWKSIASEIGKTDYRNSLKKITVPVLVLWGSNDTYCLKDDQDQFTNNLPSSTLIIYEGTGHALHWEQPAKFVQDVTVFAGGI